MLKIGVVCFEDIEQVGKAWASISGNEATRIDGLGELDSNVYWVTNLPFREFKRFNLNRKPNVFDQQFFRTSVKLIGDEVGLEDDIKGLAEFCAKTFQRVINQCRNLYDIDLKYSPYRLNTLLSDFVLSKEVRQFPMGASSSQLTEAFMQSTQQNQAMMREVPQGTKTRTFCFPKGAYARHIMSMPYPVSTQWRALNESDIATMIGTREGMMISGTKSALNKIHRVCKDKAAVFRISVLHTDKFFRPFALFGQGSNIQRNWVTLPELEELLKYCLVEIFEGFVSELGELKVHKDIDLDADEYSYSKGLMLENIWTAYSLSLNRGKFFTPVGAYMRAYDRIMCLKAAYEFERNGLIVGSFGTGRVVVYCKTSEEHIAKEIAFENGMIPPMFMMNKG